MVFDICLGMALEVITNKACVKDVYTNCSIATISTFPGLGFALYRCDNRLCILRRDTVSFFIVLFGDDGGTRLLYGLKRTFLINYFDGATMRINPFVVLTVNDIFGVIDDVASAIVGLFRPRLDVFFFIIDDLWRRDDSLLGTFFFDLEDGVYVFISYRKFANGDDLGVFLDLNTNVLKYKDDFCGFRLIAFLAAFKTGDLFTHEGVRSLATGFALVDDRGVASIWHQLIQQDLVDLGFVNACYVVFETGDRFTRSLGVIGVIYGVAGRIGFSGGWPLGCTGTSLFYNTFYRTLGVRE